MIGSISCQRLRLLILAGIQVFLVWELDSMVTPKIVIYCRFSSDMQRKDSCTDQERAVRAGLTRLGIDPTHAIVIRDEAESGTKTNRDGFEQLRQMIARKEIAVLAVDDQSRLTRGDNASAFITDLEYAGGRFIAISEGIDTDKPGWQIRVKVGELHNGQVVRDLQHRVRRGQQGRVLEDGSAGDFPLGYESYYLDDDWAAQLARRGPKPKKGLRICDAEARWVRQVFDWFVAGKSIGWITRELTRQKAPKGSRGSKPIWHVQQVHRLLRNEKYIGKWTWGKTTTKRNSDGRTKQVAVPAGQITVRDRPHLRIIDQSVWDQAANRLAQLSAVFGMKPGQRKRGPKTNPADIYPRSTLGGLLRCVQCGGKMWQRCNNGRRYYACPQARRGLCNMVTQVPAIQAEQSLKTFLLDVLRSWPEWMRTVYQQTRQAIFEAAASVPAARDRDTRQLAEVNRQIDNLVTALTEGNLKSAVVSDRLQEAEGQKAEIEARLTEYRLIDPGSVPLPDEALISERLAAWASEQATSTDEGAMFRSALYPVIAEPIIAPGKRRGYARLRFQVRAWDTLRAALGDDLSVPVQRLFANAPPVGGSGEFTLDLGQPTSLDKWAPEIVAWRSEGVIWTEIVRRTGMDLNRVYRAWNRYTTAGYQPPTATR